MMATLLLFGRLAEQAGWRRREVSLPPTTRTVAGIRALVAQDAPEASAATTRVAVNQTLALDDDLITDDDEIALMPPMSGG
jgi:molybdopterin converting factor subunit 1